MQHQIDTKAAENIMQFVGGKKEEEEDFNCN